MTELDLKVPPAELVDVARLQVDNANPNQMSARQFTALGLHRPDHNEQGSSDCGWGTSPKGCKGYGDEAGERGQAACG